MYRALNGVNRETEKKMQRFIYNQAVISDRVICRSFYGF